jgi:hypothetical protein
MTVRQSELVYTTAALLGVEASPYLCSYNISPTRFLRMVYGWPQSKFTTI